MRISVFCTCLVEFSFLVEIDVELQTHFNCQYDGFAVKLREIFHMMITFIYFGKLGFPKRYTESKDSSVY